LLAKAVGFSKKRSNNGGRLRYEAGKAKLRGSEEREGLKFKKKSRVGMLLPSKKES